MRVLPNTNNFYAATNFKGTWDKEHFEGREFIYDKKCFCDYYVKEYHPFADETEEEIKTTLQECDKKLHPYLYTADAKQNTFVITDSGNYISVRRGTRLKETRAEFDARNQIKTFLINFYKDNHLLKGVIAEIMKLSKPEEMTKLIDELIKNKELFEKMKSLTQIKV